MILCSIVVIGLYLNIPHKDYLTSPHRFFELSDNKQISSDTLYKLIELVLKNIFWIWSRNFYTILFIAHLQEISQLAWTYRNLKQRVYNTQNINQMKNILSTNPILREEKGQEWENIGHIPLYKSIVWISQCSEVPNFILDFFLKMLQRYCKFTQVIRHAHLAKPIKNNTTNL